MTRLLSLLACVAFATTATAEPLLKITEFWVGGLDGTEATSDWFEITNFGDMQATGLNGTLFYDDDSADPTANDAMLGIDTIAPGESVIYLTSWEDDWATSADAVAAFTNMWGSPAGNLTGVQIGYVDNGGGLGGSNDAVFVFDGNTEDAGIVASQAYAVFDGANHKSFVANADGNMVNAAPFGTTFPFRAVEGYGGAYAGNFPASDAVGVPNPIGSPGVVGQVPEPSTVIMVMLGVAAVGIVARRRS